MQRCIIHIFLNIKVIRPCCDMQLQGLKLFTGWYYRFLKVPIEVKLSSKGHFIRPMNVSPTEKEQRKDSDKYQQGCLLSCFSITVTMRFVNTLRQFLIFLFFDNSKRNCYKLQQYTWHLWDRKIRLFLRTSDTNRTFLFAARS